MHKISLGIVGFLGILMPGALLVLNIIVPLAATFGSLQWLEGKANYRTDTLLIIILILIAFTLGTILRTFPPRWAEWPYRCLSKDWCFQEILESYLGQPQRKHFSSIPDHVWMKYYDPEVEKDNIRKHWKYMRLFNFAKNYVIAKSERLASEVQTAEGLSRFTASVFWCSLAGFFISIAQLLTIMLVLHEPLDNAHIAIYFGVANLLLFIGSARGIGTIRKHEGEVVMQSFFCVQLMNQENLDTEQQPHGDEDG